MNVTKTSLGNLTEEICVEIVAADYISEVETELKKYRKEAKIPGFRPGQVPMGLIKKMYEKPIKANALDKKINEGLNSFIDNEKLKILGEPLPIEGKNDDQSFETKTDFKFYFEVGLQPDIELNLDKIKPKYYVIEPDDDMVKRYVDDITRRFGKYESPEAIGETDVAFGEMQICDENGNIKEGEDKIKTSFAVDKVALATIKKKIIGTKIGESVTFNVHKAFKDEADRASMLRMDTAKANEINDVVFTPNSISRVTPAEMNEELFEKAFPKQDIKTEEAFINRAKEDLTKSYSKEADRYFANEVTKDLIKTMNIDLPDEFLKKWLVANAKNEDEKANVAADYEKYKDSIKWQVVEGKIHEKYNLTIDAEMIKDYYKTSLLANYFPVPETETEDEKKEREEQMNKIADNLLKNQEQTKQVYDYLYEDKLISTLKENIKYKEEKITFEKFKAMVLNQEKEK
ncbi:MAG: trigger factor family protein [Bacteroidales bacterium]|jgi:trigger factor|nr:trigger factor family protein [Bacteroidales bacterium]